jgi:hypothetical protein
VQPSFVSAENEALHIAATHIQKKFARRFFRQQAT